jgi:hypothetical protein
VKRSLVASFLVISFFSHASAPDSTRQELMELLKDRKELFDEYSSSIEKKSGFFGNKTKNDIRESQEKLVEIVNADNRIMNLLNRTIDYRNFEKQNMTYDVSSYTDRIKSLSVLNDTLTKRNELYQRENKSLRTSVRKYKFYCGLLGFLLILPLLWAARKAVRRSQ